MKRLLAIPFLAVLLMACGTATIEPNPEEVASIGTVEANICSSCTATQYVSYYYCDNSAYSCGACTPSAPYNIKVCGSIPTGTGPLSYSQCGYCGAGFYTTLLTYGAGCVADGSPSHKSSCYKPGPDTDQFMVCGTECPGGYTLSSAVYAKECDPNCTDWSSGCTGTANRMTCTKNP
jgi:hypothetical protein